MFSVSGLKIKVRCRRSEPELNQGVGGVHLGLQQVVVCFQAWEMAQKRYFFSWIKPKGGGVGGVTTESQCREPEYAG